MLRMNGKKASHVGIVLSFVIFITFIIFIFSITEPLTTVERGKQDLLKFLRVELINEFSADMTAETIIIKNTTVPECVMINTEDASNLVTVAKNEETGETLDSYFDGDKIKIKRNGAVQIKVYYSKKFINGQDISGCNNPITEGKDFDFGLVRTLKYVFNSSIVNFSQYISTSENYDAIKARFGIPASDNFGFVFEDGERNIIVQTQEKEVSTDIYVEEVPIQYVDNEANIKPGFIKIKVW